MHCVAITVGNLFSRSALWYVSLSLFQEIHYVNTNNSDMAAPYFFGNFAGRLPRTVGGEPGAGTEKRVHTD